jgi:hypothetical protein
MTIVTGDALLQPTVDVAIHIGSRIVTIPSVSWLSSPASVVSE